MIQLKVYTYGRWVTPAAGRPPRTTPHLADVLRAKGLQIEVVTAQS